MKKEYENAREFLNSVRWARLEGVRVAERINTLFIQAQSITAHLKDVSVSGGRGSVQKDEVLIAIADTTARLSEMQREITEKILLAEELIDGVDTCLGRTVLHLRYVECLRWEDIAEQLGRRGQPYGLRQVFRLHGKALAQAQKVWEDRYVDR